MILERDAELDLLTGLLREAGSSGGRVVLVRGEAGIGKTSLVDRLAAEVTGWAHVLTGACDDLLTPQPFGPIWDIGRAEASVAVPLAADDRRAVMDALLDLLSRRLRPTVMVLEDTQWADEATLDVIRFLGRRIAKANGVLVLTYRSGEVDADHPLRQVIGELPPRGLVRVHLGALSREAVASMIGGADFDLDVVMALTDGNPLFVAELLESGVERVPSSIRDSVLARASKLSSEARSVLDAVSITPGTSDRELIEGIVGPADASLLECESRGLLDVGPVGVSFRNELTRRAVESSLSPSDRVRLNREVLEFLAGDADPARLVHHARQAGDVAAIVEFAPRAARAAMAMESHREALAHFHTVEPHLHRLSGADRAAVYDDWARTAYLAGAAEAPGVADRAIALWRSIGDERALARTLTRAVRIHEIHGRPDRAAAYAREAVRLLEAGAPSVELALAMNQHAWLSLMQGVEVEGRRLAAKALAIAEEAGDDRTRIQVLITKGSCDHSAGDLDGVELVEEAHRLAQQRGYRFEEADALVHLTGMAGDVRDVLRADRFARRAVETAVRYELRSLEAYARAQHAEILMWKGDWDAAEDEATEALGTDAHADVVAWRLLGLIHTRRRRGGARGLLDRVWTLAERVGELQHLDPAAAAIAEHIWLHDDDMGRASSIEQVLRQGLDLGPPWPSGALAFWCWKLGWLDAAPPWTPEIHRSVVDGRWDVGAALWEKAGVPYERALAMIHGDDDAVVGALRIFEDLGADAAAAKVRAILRDRGVKAPRGSSRTTRAHAIGLTARQAEVLDLLAEGLSNGEIADRLFISHRTVENHVAAILMKLDASNRRAAVHEAHARGLIGSD